MSRRTGSVVRKRIDRPVFRSKMSVQTESKLPTTGSYGLVLTERQDLRRFVPSFELAKKRKERVIIDNVTKHMFPGGVRAPVLADISARRKGGDSSFHFDIVDPKRTQMRVRFANNQPEVFPDYGNMDLSRSPSISPKAIRFLKPDGTYKDVKSESLRQKRGDAWDEWKENMIQKTKDARDVLYRNTYCSSKKVRYNSCTLPRITPLVRPWTTNGLDSEGSSSIGRERSDLVENLSFPMQTDQRRPNTMHSFRRVKPSTFCTSDSDDYFEVRRLHTSNDTLRENATQLTAVVRQSADIDNIQDKRKVERPLKSENLTQRPIFTPSRRHHQGGRGRLPFMLTDREYKSVEAYKEYVSNMQKRGIEGRGAEVPGMRDGSDVSSHYGYENRVLQSVIEVNAPQKKEHGDKDKNSIVIEIKSTWDERTDRENEDDDGRSCPMNSPIIETQREEQESNREDSSQNLLK